VRKNLYIVGAVFCGILLAVAGGLLLLYKGAQQVPEEYRQAVDVEHNALQDGSDEMLRQAAALASDVKKEGQWRALFTARQINGWLAVDLPENHPRTLPETMSDPRVVIKPDCIMLFCRFQRKNLESVLSLTVEPYMAEPNVLALRIRRVRAGLVPMPLENVLAAVSKAARKAELPLQWRRADGDPVALVTIPQPRDAQNKVVEIESLRLGEGEVYLSGRTERRD